MGIETKYYTNANEPKSLGLASAAVGQIPKIKAVDSNGIPTEWEPVTLSSDMFYVLDIVEGEGNTFTINNNFDDVIAANNQGKIFVFDGICFYVSHTASETNGTITEIEFTEIGKGYVASLTWNRGNSTATITQQIFPIFGLEALSTPGVVYFGDDGKFTIKSAFSSGGIYVVKSQKDILVNDYTELENAIKNHSVIVLNSDNNDFFMVCTMASYDDTSISLTFQYSNLVIQSRIAKETKKITSSSGVIPAVEEESFYQSESGSIYWDKKTREFIIKDTTPPTATTSAAGTIKVGNGLSISADGTLSVTTATYYTGTADPVNTLGADGDLYLKTEE